MADSFTMFAKFGDVCEALEEADRKELIYAISMYGMYGEEVELPYILKPIFIALKEDIDNSKQSRKKGASGGRPKGSKPGVSKTGKPGVSENTKPGVSEVCEKNESQTKPNQTNTDQTNTDQKNKRGRFTPPTVEEVRSYCLEKGYTFDPDAFFAFYESNGWKVGRNTMRSWEAACVTWQKRQSERKEGGHVDIGELAEAF